MPTGCGIGLAPGSAYHHVGWLAHPGQLFCRLAAASGNIEEAHSATDARV